VGKTALWNRIHDGSYTDEFIATAPQDFCLHEFHVQGKKYTVEVRQRKGEGRDKR
jgi:hypothetical protein